MKLLLTLSIALFSSYTLACSCSDYPLSHGEAIREFIANRYHEEITLEEKDVRWLAYYPTLTERMAWGTFRGTSCEGSGPNGEIMVHCARSRKSDYQVMLAGRGCEVVLRVKSTYKKVSVKEISSTCDRGM